jgi:hypothetical protein
MKGKTAAIPLFVLILVAVSSGRLASQPLSWSEQFDSRANLDLGQTTAWIDTAASRATLYPFHMELQGGAGMPGMGIAVALAGDYAFVAAPDSGLSVFDISNPASPVYQTKTPAFSAFDVVVDGDYAYVAADTGGLVVFDITNPVAPTVIGGYDTGGNSYGVDVDGDIVYIADGDSGLVAVDVGVPTNPQELWTYRSPGTLLSSVDAEGLVVYATDVVGGLEAVDVSLAPNPERLDYLSIPGNPIRLDVEGPLAFVACDVSGLQVVAVVAPWALEWIGSAPAGGGASGVDAVGDVVYVATPGYGLYTLRFDDNFNFFAADSVATPGAAFALAVAGEDAFVAMQEAGLQSVRVAAAVPSPLPGAAVDTPGGVGGIDADGVFLYVADGLSGLLIYEIIDQRAPLFTGAYDTPDYCLNVQVAGPLAFLADRLDGMLVVDVTDYENPSLLGSGYDTPGLAQAIDVAGTSAYIADTDNGLVVLDITNVETPSLAGSYTTPDNAVDVEVHGDHAFVAALQGGLQIIDVSDPTSPVLAGAYDRPGAFAMGLTVSGNYCYVANDYYGLQIIDVSDPTNPSLVATYDTPGLAHDAAVSGNFVFVADNTEGMIMLDVTAPSSPLSRGSVATSQSARRLDTWGDYAYVSNGTDGFQIAQVFDRTSNLEDNTVQSVALNTPRLVSHVSLSAASSDSVRWEVSADSGATWDDVIPDESWQELSAYGTQLVWRASLYPETAGGVPVCDSMLLRYYDLVPIVVQEIRADASADGVELHWDVAADEDITGFRIYRRESAGGAREAAVHAGLLPPATRSFMDRTAEPGSAYHYTLGVVRPDGSEVRSRAVSVVMERLQAALHQNHPNPFNPATTISFVVPRPMRIELAVFSLDGALVRRLVDGPSPPGLQEVHWDGTNEAGQRVASGVYFCRYTAGTFVQTRKMVLLE